MEAKTEKLLERDGLDKNTAQVLLEMIAARYHSAQPNLMAVLSDFASKTCVMVYDYDSVTDVVSIVKYANISLNTLGVLIALHLNDSHS